LPSVLRLCSRTREPLAQSHEVGPLSLEARCRMDQAARHQIDALHAQLQRAGEGMLPASEDRLRVAAQRGAVRHCQRSGCGRRRGAHVGDEIAYGEVGLVSDAADDRDARFEHRAGEDLFVEGPQVLDRAATAAHDQDIDFGVRIRGRNRRGDLLGGAGALYRRRVQNDRKTGETARQRGQDVAQCGSYGRCDDTQRQRKGRDRSLTFGRKPARCFKPCFQPGETLVQRTEPRKSHRLDIELEFAARLVDRRGRPHLDRRAITEHDVEQLGLVPEKDAANLSLLVFEHEIAMPGRRSGESGDFPTDPGEPQVALDQ